MIKSALVLVLVLLIWFYCRHVINEIREGYKFFAQNTYLHPIIRLTLVTLVILLAPIFVGKLILS